MRPIVIAGFLLLLIWPQAYAEEWFGVLGALDKITARVSKIEAPLGEEVRFGTLKIVVRTCKKSRPTELPEVTAFLEVTDQRPDAKQAETVFKGWMFASSPAVSAIEHPVYDVWVIDCSTSDADKSRPPAKKSDG